MAVFLDAYSLLYEGHEQQTTATRSAFYLELDGLRSSQPMRKPEVTAAKKERKVAGEVARNSHIYVRVAGSDVQVINAAGGQLLASSESSMRRPPATSFPGSTWSAQPEKVVGRAGGAHWVMIRSMGNAPWALTTRGSFELDSYIVLGF